MAGLLDLLTGGGKDPAVAAFLSADRGLLNRLGAYAQAKQAAPILEQRRQILQEAYTPAQAERVQNSPLRLPSPGDESGIPALIDRVTAAKPASFDLETAQRRLISMGDIGTAKELADFQEAQRKALKGGNRQLGLQPVWMRDQSGNLVPGQLSSEGGLEVAPLPEGFSAAPRVNMEDFGGFRQGYDQFGRPIGPIVGKTQSPDSIVSNDPEAQRRIAEARAEGSAIGQGRGESVVKSDKKVANAGDILEVLAEAEPLIQRSTGSGIGKVVDVVAGGFGVSTEGAEAGDQLTILGNKLTMMVPRFEGPQSNIDVKSYEKAAGDLANTAIPVPRRLAALQIIRRLNEKYAQSPDPTAPNKPANQQARKLTAQQQMDAIKQAQAAAARGADKAVINKRLRDLGVNYQVK